MEDKNKLLYEEKRLLTLYRQMLRKEYDVNNKAKYENNDELKNRVEMQQAIYLIDKLMWTDQYEFLWDTYGPKSMRIEENLNLLDNKEHLIKDFYLLFDNNIYSQDTIKKLKYLYNYSKIRELERFTKLTSDILDTDKGLEILADLTFINSKIIPRASFNIANRELQKLRPIFNNNDLNKYAFRCLEACELIDSIDNTNGYVKRISK